VLSQWAADSHSWKYWIPDNIRCISGEVEAQNSLKADVQVSVGDLRLVARSRQGFNKMSMHAQ
jgi:hypothetical protein